MMPAAPAPASVDAGQPLQQALQRAASLVCCAPSSLQAAPARSSRRRRLWELEGHAHCPVVGVCLPLASARRLVGKVLGGTVIADDYELHCGLVTDCKQHTPAAKAVQRLLDERYASSLRSASTCKTAPALAAWWQARSAGSGLAGALWATITHPDCDARLEQQVLGEVHMRQHQVGHEQRADLVRLQTLERDNAALQAEVAALRARLAQQAAESAAQREAAQSQSVRLRGDLLARDTRIAQLTQAMNELREAAPDLPSRRALAEQLALTQERLLQLRRAVDRAESVAQRLRPKDADHDRPDPARLTSTARLDLLPDNDAGGDTASVIQPQLQHRNVLCVGGRTGAVPGYRAVLEDLGARFEHHDGGQEHNPQRLQASLAAADLVICQAGCVSHDAYWRVKEHCKRTGKRCVFVESPGAGALQRALHQALATGEAGAHGKLAGASVDRSPASKSPS